MDIRFEDYEQLLRKWSWKWHYTTGEDPEELFQEMTLVFFESINQYQPERGAFSTYLYYRVRSHLISGYLPSTPCYKNGFQQIGEGYILTDEKEMERTVDFKLALQTLTEDARAVCQMVFEAPEEVLCYTPKLARGTLKDSLRKKGWAWARIWDSFREIKTFLKEVEL